MGISLVLVVLTTVVTSAANKQELKCKARSGCHFSGCDPVQSLSFAILDRNEFPIACETSEGSEMKKLSEENMKLKNDFAKFVAETEAKLKTLENQIKLLTSTRPTVGSTTPPVSSKEGAAVASSSELRLRCPEPTAGSPMAVYNMAWLCDLFKWRESIADFKKRFENECNVTDVETQWEEMYQCPDFSNITCIHESSLGNRTDSFNCSIIFCKDGHYEDEDALPGIWRQQFHFHRTVMNFSDSINCTREFPTTETPVEAPSCAKLGKCCTGTDDLCLVSSNGTTCHCDENCIHNQDCCSDYEVICKGETSTQVYEDTTTTEDVVGTTIVYSEAAVATDASTVSNYDTVGTSGEETSTVMTTISQTTEASKSTIHSYGNVSVACSGVETLNGTAGVISSSHYPSYYQNNANCSWEISVPEGMVIAVKSGASFAVETSTSCEFDALTFDSDKTFCGYDAFPSFRTEDNRIKVTFTSDRTVTDRGFSFQWTAVENSSIPDSQVNYVSDHNGTISSPNYPSKYNHFIDQVWIIKAPVNSTMFQPAISIEFEPLFGLEGVVGTKCPYDYLTISAGSEPPTGNEDKWVLCDSTQPSKLLFKTTSVYVSFKTDDSVNDVGFYFNFTVFDFCADGCIWTHDVLSDYTDYYYSSYTDRMNYSQAENVCKSRESEVAVIWNEHMYSDVVNDLRTSRNSQEFIFWLYSEIWVGMTIDTTSGNLTPEDAYYSWILEPYLVEGQTNIYLEFYEDDGYKHIGMRNTDPDTIRLSGVACWKTPETGNATSQDTSPILVNGSQPSLYTSFYDDTCHDEGLQSGLSGILSSPHYPSYYQNNANCSWEISVPDGMVIAVKSDESFAIETSTTESCEYDAVTFDAEGYNKIFCGYDVFTSFWTTTNRLKVTFTSDVTGTDRGFSFKWNAVDNSSIPDPRTRNISAASGVISSPNYPMGYDNFLDYIWIIKAADSEAFQPAISIEFEPLFDLERPAGRKCPYDSLTISEGSEPPTDNVNTVELCGSTQPSKLIFEGRELYVSFRTDNSINGAGFSFNFTLFDKCSKSCFWTHVGSSYLTKEQAISICESRESVMAVVPSEEVYHAIVDDFRHQMQLNNYWSVEALVNMTYNVTSDEVTPREAYYAWFPGNPSTWNDQYNIMYIYILRDKLNHAGMANAGSDRLYNGVVCWRPPTAVDDTTTQGTIPTNEYGEGTSRLTYYPKGCNSTLLDFWHENHLDYVQYKETLPNLASLTICAWVWPKEDANIVKGVLLSYCTIGAYRCNTLYINLGDGDVTVSLQNDSYQEFENTPTIDSRSHLCFVMSTESAKMQYYVNATEASTALNVTTVISGGGVIIVGQDQDEPFDGSSAGAPNNSVQGFHGMIEGFQIWNRTLSEAEIDDMYQSGCNCATDAVINFDSSNSIVTGHVITDWSHSCSPGDE